MSIGSQAEYFVPATYDVRPERPHHVETFSDKLVKGAVSRVNNAGNLLSMPMKRFVNAVNTIGIEFSGYSERELKEEVRSLKRSLRVMGLKKPLVARSFALVREISDRVLHMRHYDCQVMGGWAIFQGMVAEMQTGEGKTLAATLPVCTAAFAGIPVHVVSVNDYLTARDAEQMAPLYAEAGLSVGCVVHGLDPEERRQAYSKDITYCTNKELVFDYLKDQITLDERPDSLSLQAEIIHSKEARVNRLLLRGLHFAIVDEADSILIDEARTPLIISGKASNDTEERVMHEAMDVVACLENGIDYSVHYSEHEVRLTSVGEKKVDELACELGPLWKGKVRRQELVSIALSACYLFKKDEHYLVRDDSIQIIDAFTGRVMPDRSWQQGLQQLIEIKEGCKVTHQRETLARISYQNFFCRYIRLGGMTGTANEVRGELWDTYGVCVKKIPNNLPCQRNYLSDQLYSNADAKWQAVLNSVRTLQADGRPVLVGTRTVASSEEVSHLFSGAGIDFRILNAKQDKEEAEIIAQAGEAGKITIATNMAGRGTDIKLADGVKNKGGLHVILTECHEAGRIDRQLAGRCARQGDPGSFEVIVSLDDALFSENLKGFIGWVTNNMMKCNQLPGWMKKALLRGSQKRLEKRHFHMRRELMKMDQKRSMQLSFSGRQG